MEFAYGSKIVIEIRGKIAYNINIIANANY